MMYTLQRLILLNGVSARHFHIAGCGCDPFIFTAVWCSTAHQAQVVVVSGHLGSFQLLAPMNQISVFLWIQALPSVIIYPNWAELQWRCPPAVVP